MGLAVAISGTAFALAFVLTISAPLAAKEPRGLDASSKWLVDFAPNKCRLVRTFGEGEDRHAIFFEQYWPSARTGLSLAGPRFKRFRSKTNTRMKFFDGQEAMPTEPFKGDTESVGPAIVYSSISLSMGAEADQGYAPGAPNNQLDTNFANKVEFVWVRQRGKEVQLNTGPLGDAFAVLNKCTADLVRDWGLNPEEQSKLSRAPVWKNEKEVVRSAVRKYPNAALVRGEEAILRMRVMIDESGTVTDCILNEATVTDKLNSPFCQNMEMAEFDPAIDAKGKPIASYYATSITYRIRD
ncbi:energy transducer TonB [Erythrobacter sp. F6033]|uniref:energy transducer TonB n=1 Tax=Erythrobacter sp. F6033 TaxID=2926401 RepID=UPI001FF671D3|nr:energy transducer TonB [Erythrobacter sp. F6033]MCK0129833.1 energy transducer TonB [Erythrobacter sp. F6033]